ncbi:hypothetical protein EGW08_020816, partial [Elysia chlorotica]
LFLSFFPGIDLITCLVTIPFTIAYELLQYHLVYDLVCKTYMFLITSTIPFSAYIMVGIAVDRYLCICHPLLQVFTVSRVKLVISLLTIPAMVFGILTALSFGTSRYESATFSINRTYAGSMLNKSEMLDRGSVYTIYVGKRDATIEIHHMNSQRIQKKENQHILRIKTFIYYGTCTTNGVFSNQFLAIYTKVHALNFMISFIIVVVLYVLIYKSIITRRAEKEARRNKNYVYTAGRDAGLEDGNVTEETEFTQRIFGGRFSSCGKAQDSPTNDKMHDLSSNATTMTTFSPEMYMANIKTALMLLVVTTVFMVAFLPSLLMANNVLPKNLTVFYGHYIYHVTNPFIYAFMNQNFRDDLRKLLSSAC